ncbi:zinc transporter ZIP3-like [Euwallacea fornicatus]|uniref:zinc transporter ZIP3-like n=1 Tax=Euwallacea fornicatus TaxID=995702 RepID=UPI00338D48CD
MNLTSTKICVALIFGFWRFFWGILPVKLDRWFKKTGEKTSPDSKTFINERRHQQVSCLVALTQSFGGGVLFATCFLHMIKELFLSVEEIKVKWNINNEYPISQLIIATGFFFVYFLEEFSHWVINRNKKKGCTKENVEKVAKVTVKSPTSSMVSSTRSTRSFKSSKVSPVKTVATIEEWELNNKNHQLNSNRKNHNGLVITKLKNEKPSVEPFLNSPENNEKLLQRTFSSKSSRHSIQEEIDRANFEIIREERLTPEAEEEVKDQEQLMRCVLTIAALCLHSLLEGLSIGIQKFQYEIWYLFVAISIHSASILFCIGVELILAQTRVKYIIVQMTILALASPLGIFLGLLVTEETSMKASTMSVTSIALEGFSAGTILYITFFEVLNREKERRVYRVRRGLCIVGGFALMALLQFSESKYGKHGLGKEEGLLNVTVS